MAIKYHPDRGTVLICDFKGLIHPEMNKRRPVIVISSPPRRESNRLCTIVALSNTPPNPKMMYNGKIIIEPPLPKPYDKLDTWIKGDMVYRMSFDRLNLIFKGKDSDGKRIYYTNKLSCNDLKEIENCVLSGIGLHKLVDLNK